VSSLNHEYGPYKLTIRAMSD
jgi:hypothetical protein